MVAIELCNVSKIFKTGKERKSVYDMLARRTIRESSEKIIALDNISFTIEDSEMVGIIGPNGSGKTTLLRVICGITNPTSGIVRTHGKVVPFLQLGSAFNGELNAIENIKLSGIIMGMRKRDIEQRVEEVLKYAELENFATSQVKHFSAGMFARLAFATAIQVEPKILVLDEVLAVGDLAFQKKSYKTLLSLRDEGKTIVYVTHNLMEVERLCNNAILLQHGKLVSTGDPKEVVSKYKKLIEEVIKEEDKDIVKKITEFYRNVLKREPDEAGMADFIFKIKSGKLNLDDVPDILRNSSEYSRINIEKN